MVAIPVTNDQPGVAARIVYSKTGLALPLPELTTPKLASLIDEVLTNGIYRKNAQAMKRAIAKTNGLKRQWTCSKRHSSSQGKPSRSGSHKKTGDF